MNPVSSFALSLRARGPPPPPPLDIARSPSSGGGIGDSARQRPTSTFIHNPLVAAAAGGLAADDAATALPGAGVLLPRQGSHSARSLISSMVGSLTFPTKLTYSLSEREATSEHERVSSMASSLAELEVEFGGGVAAYFRFLHFVSWSALAPSVCAAVCYAVAWSGLRSRSGLDAAMLGLFPGTSTMRSVWAVSTTCIYAYAFGAAAAFTTRRCDPSGSLLSHAADFTPRRGEGDGAPLDTQTYDTVVEDELPISIAVARSTAEERFAWRALSLALFGTMLALQAVINFALMTSLKDAGTQTLALSVAVYSACSSVLIAQLTKLCTARLEMHLTLTSTRHSNVIKLLALKLVSISLLYIVKLGAGAGIVTASDSLTPIQISALACVTAPNSTAVPISPSGAPPLVCDCPLLSLGWQFFYLVVIDCALSLVGEPLFGLCRMCVLRRAPGHSRRSDGEEKMPFNTDDEYVGVLNRWFLGLFGAPVFPLLVALVLISFVCEHWVDKWKLVHLSRKDVVVEGPLNPLLVAACLAVIPVAAIILYPVGFAYVLALAVQGGTSGLAATAGFQSCNVFGA